VTYFEHLYNCPSCTQSVVSDKNAYKCDYCGRKVHGTCGHYRDTPQVSVCGECTQWRQE
jgi:hypothetical protein